MSNPDPNAARLIEVFYAYSHKDEALRDQLETHLSILRRRGIISGWHDRRISVGTEWAGKISDYLNRADIILLLVSADFIASDYCYDKEMTRAMERHDLGEALVVPVILRPCDFEGAPFARLQGLPKDMKPITRWIDQDEAFTNVAVGIRKAAEELRTILLKSSAENTSAPRPSGSEVHQQRSPRLDPYGLRLWGPRLEVEVGLPILRATTDPFPDASLPNGTNFCRMPALIDTGASRTVLTPAAVARIGLPRVGVTRIVRVGGTNEDVSVYAASIQFPRGHLATIEVMEVMCCDLPMQPIQCLIGRDVLSRWQLTYDGPTGGWAIRDK